MSREAIENTISEMRSVYDRSTDARFAYFVNRADIKDWADTIEKNVADIIAENERLKKELAETKEALKPIDDIYLPDYSICATCYGRSECEGPEYSVTCEWHDIVEAVQKAKSIIGGWSWTRISEKD